MISRTQMRTHDYDWFCIINDKPVCVSSAGSDIPDIINIDNYVLNSMYRAYQLPRTCGFWLNTPYLAEHIINKGFEYLSDESVSYREILRPRDISFPEGTPLEVCYYSEYFAKIAERGFWVFDRDIQNTERDSFHLVAWPVHPGHTYRQLYDKMFSQYSVAVRTDNMDFNDLETLVDIDLLKLFTEERNEVFRDYQNVPR